MRILQSFPTPPPHLQARPVAPKISDEKALAAWALPVAGVNATPNFYSEAEYYAAPTGDFLTSPLYHPDREPAGYMDWLRAQETTVVPWRLIACLEIVPFAGSFRPSFAARTTP